MEHSFITLSQIHLARIFELLKNGNLPTEDIDIDKQDFIGLLIDGIIVAVGALEYFNRDALIRSIAVDENYKSKGYGTAIVNQLVLLSKSKPITDIYLLTTTAQSFFEKFSFTEIDRSKITGELTNSPEFSHLCPDSATCMMLNIKEL